MTDSQTPMKLGPCMCPDCLMHRAAKDMLLVLDEVEIIMSIVPPQSSLNEYLACLQHVRRVIAEAKGTKESSP